MIEKIDFTKIWKFDGTQLVIAPTIEEAISLYKTYRGDPTISPISIEAVGIGDDYLAIIKVPNI